MQQFFGVNLRRRRNGGAVFRANDLNRNGPTQPIPERGPSLQVCEHADELAEYRARSGATCRYAADRIPRGASPTRYPPVTAATASHKSMPSVAPRRPELLLEEMIQQARRTCEFECRWLAKADAVERAEHGINDAFGDGPLIWMTNVVTRNVIHLSVERRRDEPLNRGGPEAGQPRVEHHADFRQRVRAPLGHGAHCGGPSRASVIWREFERIDLRPAIINSDQRALGAGNILRNGERPVARRHRRPESHSRCRRAVGDLRSRWTPPLRSFPRRCSSGSRRRCQSGARAPRQRSRCWSSNQ